MSDVTDVLTGKHVLLVVENNPVPFDRRVWREALTLRDAGARVSIISPKAGTQGPRQFVEDDVWVFEFRDAPATGSAVSYLYEYLVAFIKTLWLLHLVWFRRGRIHIVHVANPPDIWWSLALYGRVLRYRFIFDEHDLTPETYLARFGRDADAGGMIVKVLRWFQRLSYRFAHAIISTNQSYRDHVGTVNEGYLAKTFIVRNGPDTRWFAPCTPDPALRRGGRRVLAYIGIMGVQDGVDYIIRAVDVLVHQHRRHDIVVYLIGSGDDRDRLEALSVELGLTDFIVFTGRISDDDVLRILSTSDVCLSPDPVNPLNDRSTMNKVMEYMALGKPIVSFGLKETRFSAQDAVHYVDNNSVEAFAAGILHLLNYEREAVEMGQRGLHRVDTVLCWQRQTEHLIRTYRFVLGARSEPG